MAYYFYNDQESSTVAGAVLRTLAASDSITFGASAIWSSSNGTALMLGGANQVTVHGQLYGKTAILGNAPSNTITVSQTGVVSGALYGIDMTGGASDLYNHGFVSGQTAAFVGAASRVINGGTISGVYLGLAAVLNSAFTLDNTGTISAYQAINLNGSQSFTINNSGQILAGAYAIISSNDISNGAINNSGTIDGAMTFSTTGAISINNVGLINGTIFFSYGDDIFDSSSGHCTGTAYGAAGDDILIGSTDRNLFFGGADGDELYGNDGNDMLSGGAGADILDGGTGRDLASYMDAAAGVFVDLASPNLNSGDAAGDVFISIEGIVGSEYQDQLYGDGARNHIDGGLDDDLLNGRGGDDLLRGGYGDDHYFVDSSGDRLIEKASQGTDLVTSTADAYTLAANIENLKLAGSAAIDGTGNDLGNKITGNAGANSIAGGLGNDILHGGGGADGFRFDTVLDAAANVDTIDDFATGTDKLQLSHAIFTELNGGAALQAARFVSGAVAHDASDRIVYDTTTGNLFYDADGNGAMAQVLFAHVDAGLALTAADFVLVG